MKVKIRFDVLTDYQKEQLIKEIKNNGYWFFEESEHYADNEEV
jgi:hypothetical protein